MGLAKIKNNIDNLAKSYNVANQTLWDMFFFEKFLNRLSKSKYKANFVFKGGFLLGSIVGIEQRTTLDIDLKYVGTNLDDVVLLNVFREICEVDLDDEIKYEVLDTTDLLLKFIEEIVEKYPQSLEQRYKIEIADKTPLEVYEEIARKRGFIISRGEIDYERTANVVFDEFRKGLLGRISLEE